MMAFTVLPSPKHRLLGMVAAPDPDECIRQRLLKNAPVAVTRRKGENESVVVTLCLERSRSALAGHYPVVMGFLQIFRSNIVFGHVREDAQRFLLAVFDQLHAG